MKSTIYQTFGSVEQSEVRHTTVRLEKTGDRQVDQLQSNILSALEPVLSLPLLGANLFRDVAFSSGVPRVIQHRLGRKFLDALVCAPSGAVARFQRIAQSADLDEHQVTLQADATTVATVVIF